MNKVFKIILVALSVVVIISCNKDNKAENESDKDSISLDKYVEKINSELVFVEGGSFLMGDFGEQYGPEHLPYDSKADSKPLHKVELSSYSIGKFKVSNEEYGQYLTLSSRKPRVLTEESGQKQDWDAAKSTPTTPAHVDWFEAENYCKWLASVTKLSFTLPTEAQWEYAARSRGQYFIVLTNDGTLRINEGTEINVASEKDSKLYSRKMGTTLDVYSPLPGDLYPPNPLGIYDMAGNGWEWVKDWYAPDYYKHSPVRDPQGPDKPVFKDSRGNYTKVIRSQDFSGPRQGATIARFNSDPLNQGYLPSDKTVRCVVNSPVPIK